MAYRTYADAIKHMLTMREVAEYYGFTVNRRTNKIHCPFHEGDNTGSLHIYSGDRGFYCFGCGVHGSVIDFVMLLFDLPFMDACIKINRDFNLRLGIGERQDYEQRKQREKEYSKYLEEKRTIEQKRKLLFMMYFAAYNRFAYLDMMKWEERPKSPGEPVSKRYIFACKYIDEAWQDVLDATEKLRAFEDEHGKKHIEEDDPT